MRYDFFLSYFSNLVDSKLSGKSKDSDFEYFRQKQLLLRKPKSSSPPKEAGVTLLCYPKAGLMHLALMKRPTYSGVHSGQISLPGGKKEDTDLNLWQTAQRECNEELGTQLQAGKPLLRLNSIYIPPSHFLVSPYVTHHPERPNFKPNSREVDQLIELPLNQLVNFNIKERVLTEGAKAGKRVPSFQYKEHIIWGATALILYEFKTFLRQQL